MRIPGKIVLWLGIFMISALIAVATLVIGLGFATDDAEVVGFGMIYGMFFGLPIAIVGAILILIGAVLITSAPKVTRPRAPSSPTPLYVPSSTIPNKSRYQPAVVQPAVTRSGEDSLRAAMTAGTSHLHTVALLIRVVAVGVFIYFFVTRTYPSLKLYSYMANISAKDYVLLIGVGLVMAAIIPLILWLVSNFVKTRAHISDGSAA